MPDDLDKEAAIQILSMLAPLTRRDTWWHSDGPVSLLEDFIYQYRLRRAPYVKP